MLKWAWIQADDVQFPGHTNTETAELIHQVAKSHFPTASKILQPQEIHSTLVYIDCDVNDTLIDCLREVDLEAMNFQCNILAPHQGDSNTKMIMLSIQADAFSEAFHRVWTALEAVGIHPAHTKQDETRYKYGFSAHLTLAEFDEKEAATDAMAHLDVKKFFADLKDIRSLTVKNFFLYGDNSEGHSTQVFL